MSKTTDKVILDANRHHERLDRKIAHNLSRSHKLIKSLMRQVYTIEVTPSRSMCENAIYHLQLAHMQIKEKGE